MRDECGRCQQGRAGGRLSLSLSLYIYIYIYIYTGAFDPSESTLVARAGRTPRGTGLDQLHPVHLTSITRRFDQGERERGREGERERGREGERDGGKNPGPIGKSSRHLGRLMRTSSSSSSIGKLVGCVTPVISSSRDDDVDEDDVVEEGIPSRRE
jgi:hypothetical protein